jgi:CubicO group peptidase (beta-lactamase class C family)
MYEALRDPDSLLYRSTFGSLHVSWDSANDPRWVLAEAPSSDGTAGAPSLARFFAMLAGEVDGVRLLSKALVDQARTPASTGEDRVLRIPTTYGLGYALPGGPLFRPVVGSGRAFGHGGATGSLAYGDPDHELALAYVPNRMSEAIEGGEERVWSLVEAAYRCL